MNKANKYYTYRESTKNGKQQSYRYFPNIKHNNSNSYNDIYEANNKITENDNRSNILKSKEKYPLQIIKYLRS